MSGNAGRFLHYFFRLIAPFVIVVLAWGSVSLPLYADVYYAVRNVYATQDSHGFTAPGLRHFVGPDVDQLDMLNNEPANLCLSLLFEYFNAVQQTKINETLVSYETPFVSGVNSVSIGCRLDWINEKPNPSAPGGVEQLSYEMAAYIDILQCAYTNSYEEPGWIPDSNYTFTGYRLTCFPPLDCVSWAQSGDILNGYMDKPLTTPIAYCKKLNENDPLADQCEYQYSQRSVVHSPDGLVVGYNVTLTPTNGMCPDVPGVMWIDELLPDGQTQSDVVGGEPQPSTETDGGADQDMASDPDPTQPQVDPETILQSEELLQEMLKHIQELNTQAAKQSVQTDDINDELNEQTDVLNKILNSLGNREGDGKSASSPLDCEQILNCVGDPIQCSILQEQRRSRCALNFGDSDSAILALNSRSEQEILDFKAGTTLDFASALEDAPRYSASCPAPESFLVYGHSLEISYDPLCGFAPNIKPWVLMAAYLTAAFIVFRAV